MKPLPCCSLIRRPSERAKRYTEAHEWIELSPDRKIGTVGISQYAAHALGDVTYVELPKPSATFAVGDALAAVESVKSASDIYAPCGGTIVEVNSALEDKPDTIGRDAEGEMGWLAKIELEGDEEAKRVDDLMDAETYRKFTEEAMKDDAAKE